jgi:hypothetical protein
VSETTDEMIQELRAIHAALGELDGTQFLMVLSPMIVRLVKEYGADRAKEMLVSTIDAVLYSKTKPGPVS